MFELTCSMYLNLNLIKIIQQIYFRNLVQTLKRKGKCLNVVYSEKIAEKKTEIHINQYFYLQNKKKKVNKNYPEMKPF